MSAPLRPSAWTAADARAVTQLMLLVVALRVATALVAFLANVAFPLAQREQFTVLGATHHFLDPFARDDAGWYFGIASRGYQWVEGGRNSSASTSENIAVLTPTPRASDRMATAKNPGLRDRPRSA